MRRIMGRMNITFDSEVDAAYIKIHRGSVYATRKIADNFLIDVDRRGKVLGIELLFFSAS